MSLPFVHLVRHGETAWSLSRQHTGRTDIPLTPKGQSDAKGLRETLHALPITRVLSSPLIRARQTAELAGFASALELDPDLMEWSYGSYEGRRTAEIRQEHPGWNAFIDGYPGGESISDVAARADRVIAKLRRSDGNALVFAHRDILRVIAVRWIGLDASDGRRIYLETASLSVLGYDHDRSEPVIHALNQRAVPLAKS